LPFFPPPASRRAFVLRSGEDWFGFAPATMSLFRVRMVGDIGLEEVFPGMFCE
jgi:hypothetical protein